MDRLRLLVETYNDYQKARIAFFNRLNIIPEEIRKKILEETKFKQIGNDMKKLERSIVNEIKKELKGEILYEKILGRIKGIGPVLAGSLISLLCRERDFLIAKSHPKFELIKKLKYAKIQDLGKQVRVMLPSVLDLAKYPSDLYAYCALIPGAKREKGKQIKYNPKLKTLFWKIFRQILIVGKSYYCTMYQMEKEKFLKKYKDIKEGSYKVKAHLTAIKKLSRHLALTIYLAYKYFKNQPRYLPYPIEVLRHEVEPPFVDSPEGKEELDWLLEGCIIEKRPIHIIHIFQSQRE